MIREWLFEPLDVLFFRNSLPFSPGETGYLKSIFPPTPETMQGVVRSAILLSHCAKISSLGDCMKDNETKCLQCPKGLLEVVGNAKRIGKMKLWGPYLVKDETRYFPTPADIVKEKGGDRVFLLTPDLKEPISCDLGSICFPTLPAGVNVEAVAPVGGWISERLLGEYLNGEPRSEPLEDLKQSGDLLPNSSIYEEEPKVGLGRDLISHKVKEGYLYSIELLRLKEGWKIALRVENVPEELEPQGKIMTVGGEGRLCGIEIRDYSQTPGQVPTDRWKIVFLQPAYLPKSDGSGPSWLLPGFVQKNNGPKNHWEGKIGGTPAKLWTACLGKSFKTGGWDIAIKAPKPSRSYVPAGSVYYLEVKNGSSLSWEGKLGEKTEIGFGHYRVGGW